MVLPVDLCFHADSRRLLRPRPNRRVSRPTPFLFCYREWPISFVFFTEQRNPLAQPFQNAGNRSVMHVMPRQPPDYCEENSSLYALSMEALREQELIEAEEEHDAGRLSPNELVSIGRSIAQALAELRPIIRQPEREQDRLVVSTRSKPVEGERRRFYCE